MRLRTQTLRPGTRLYHGTSGDFHPADLRTPAWFSDIPEATDFFQTWHGNEGNPHQKVYTVTSPLRLLKIIDQHEMDEVQELAGTADTHDFADWVLRQGYAGWIIPDNYGPGADIMLGSLDGLAYEEDVAESVVESLHVIAAEHLVAHLLESEDIDPTDEVNSLLPYGKWHPVHGVTNAMLRSFFKGYGLKLLRTYRSRRDGSMTGVVQNVGGLVDADKDTWEIQDMLKKFLWGIDGDGEILVHFFPCDRRDGAGNFFFALDRRDTREAWNQKGVWP